jgi:hypothetical protein
MPRKMARQTLERHAGACYAGSRPYLGSGLLGTPENRYNLPHFRVHPGNPGLHTPLTPMSALVNIARFSQPILLLGMRHLMRGRDSSRGKSEAACRKN